MNGHADYVTVDRYLPADSQGHFLFAHTSTSVKDTGDKLWVALAEKAYAQANESRPLGLGNGEPAHFRRNVRREQRLDHPTRILPR